jgi:hypothetical protein
MQVINQDMVIYLMDFSDVVFVNNSKVKFYWCYIPHLILHNASAELVWCNNPFVEGDNDSQVTFLPYIPNRLNTSSLRLMAYTDRLLLNMSDMIKNLSLVEDYNYEGKLIPLNGTIDKT